ncbi:putative isomerase YbhE [Lipomyces kononenkoae]|uniref:Isomerase YbhE n=1 Tax=Lipomyces kononenkoae TaxID=34357 RepID=A0ACC3T4E9_LIPKO
MLAHSLFVFFVLSSLLLVGALENFARPDSSPYILYVALQSRGILTLSFDPSKSVQASLEILATNTDAGFMPGWLTLWEDKLFSISRTHFPTNASASGGAFSFQKYRSQRREEGSAPSWSLELLSNITSGGLGGVYCDVSRDGRTLSVANIDGSTVSVHPLLKTGIIGDASYLFKYNLSHPGPGTNGSQIQSNPHEAIFDPSGKYMFVNDRGADRIYVYHVDGPYNVTQISTVVLPPGTGPRHSTFSVFNSTRTYMYLASELDNTVRVFTLDGVANSDETDPIVHAPTLDITLRQTASTLGPGGRRTLPNDTFLASEVAMSHDGNFLYVSNRATTTFKSDTLTIYSVHPNIGDDSAHLEYLGQNLTYGKIPRHFSLSPDAHTRYAAVANEVTQNLVILERDTTTGFFTGMKGNISFGTLDVTQNLGPAAVIWDESKAVVSYA